MKNSRNIIIATLLIVILLMAVGYSAFATQLTLNGTAEIIGQWDVKIAGITIKELSDGVDGGTPQFTNTSVTFNAKLVKPGDSITYEITIENAGTIDAKLSKVTFTAEAEGSEAIIYTNTEPAQNLAAGEQTTFSVTIEFDQDTTAIPEVKTRQITGIVEYVQA